MGEGGVLVRYMLVICFSKQGGFGGGGECINSRMELLARQFTVKFAFINHTVILCF